MSKNDLLLQNIPIEFKEIRPSDFDTTLYSTSTNVVQEDENGYISNDVVSIVKNNYDEKNIVVINSGVGQGKTKAVLKMIHNYSKNDEYVVLVAVPYNSLIKQYVEDIQKEGVNGSKIFNFLKFDEYNVNPQEVIEKNEADNPWKDYVDDEKMIAHYKKKFKISRYKVHVITINGLLRNPGAESMFQAKDKRVYFNKLITHCRENNKKLILFLDEIHDSIHNFREDLLYKFWEYFGVIHKIFMVSATYNEASKEVIKYLSEFTDKKIQILESKRLIIPEKQSKLHLVLQDDFFNIFGEQLKFQIEYLIKENKKFDIICYSSKQSKTIIKAIKDELPKEFSQVKDRINDCFNDLGKETKRYEVGKINIGTNFTTGVNIEDENHTLIIILPKRTANITLTNKGVFSSGSISIIQALARQRRAGDIYVYMPSPFNLIEDSLIDYGDTEKQEIIKTFRKYATPESEVSYSPINNQAEELERAYESLQKMAENAKNIISEVDRKNMNRLEFLPKEIFIMERGEKYLSNSFFGGDISSFVFWAALTNQFQNCKLESILGEEKINLPSDQVIPYIIYLYEKFREESDSEDGHKVFTPYSVFECMDSLTSKKDLYIDDKEATKGQKEEITLATLNIIINDGKVPESNLDKKALQNYYLLSSIYNASIINMNQKGEILIADKHYKLSDNNIDSIRIFKKWYHLSKIVMNSVQKTGKDEFLLQQPSQEFINLFNELNMGSQLSRLLYVDYILRKRIFPFGETLLKYIKKNENEKLIQSFYDLTVKVLYNSELKQKTIQKKRLRVHIIKSLINPKEMKNFLYNSNSLPAFIF